MIEYPLSGVNRPSKYSCMQKALSDVSVYIFKFFKNFTSLLLQCRFRQGITKNIGKGGQLLENVLNTGGPENARREELGENIRITLTAVSQPDHGFHIGEKVRLSADNGRFCFLDDNNCIVASEICANVTAREAKLLSFVKAGFTITQVSGRIIKAEMTAPQSLSYDGTSEWSYLV